MKESRLFKIVYLLLEKGRITAPELANEFEVSIRTIYRDIDALSGAGIPIYAQTGRNGGIALLDHFVLDKVLLSDQEKKAMLADLHSLSMMNPLYEKNVITKLSALFQMPSQNWFEVDFSRWGTGKEDNQRFETIKHAILNHQVLQITYVDSYGNQSDRKIQPITLLFKSKAWYLKAYCLKKQSFSTFKFNRMITLETTDERFDDIIFPDYEEVSPQTYPKVTLRFPSSMAYRIYDEFNPEDIEVTKDEHIIASAPMPNDAWLVGYILSFGTQVEVLQPLHLRDIIAKEAKKILKIYKP